MRKRTLLSAFTFSLLLMSMARPLPTGAEIAINAAPSTSTTTNPPPTAANKQLVIDAVYRLAGDRRLANHPIRRYLNDPS
jgi:hypothetical protein